MTQTDSSINAPLPVFPWKGGFLKLALDALLPPQCLSCGEIVDGIGALCPRCWDDVDFVDSPMCQVCGLTFEYDPGEGSLCGACVKKRPIYERARTVMSYGDVSRRLIISFKHGDGTEAAPSFGRWLARAGGELLADADLVTPVPLHWTRLFTRRYNQSALLAQEIGRRTGVVVEHGILVRRRKTPSQAGLKPRERQRNMKGAFAVRPSLHHKIKNQRVLLVDDVLTTGATVSACAKTLLRAGAKAVDVLTLARVMRPTLF